MTVPLFTAVPSLENAATFNADWDDLLGKLNPWTSAINAIASSLQLSMASTSVTSLTVGMGSKTLTVGGGLGILAGMQVFIAHSATPATHRMVGVVDAYVSGTGALTVTVSTFVGFGTHATWDVGPTADQDAFVLALSTGLSSTSTTDLTVGSGSKTLTIAPGKPITPGVQMFVADASAPAMNRMVGTVTEYDFGTGALTIDVSSFVGSGTLASWTLGFSATVDPATYVTLNGTETLTGKTLDGCVFINGHTEEVATANTSTAYTIDLANGGIQVLTLTGNCTYTFPAAAPGKSFLLMQKQDATGSRTVTWPAAVKWPGSVAPILTATASKADMFAFVSDGTNWYGRVVAQTYL